jgi:hypothetical protein
VEEDLPPLNKEDEIHPRGCRNTALLWPVDSTILPALSATATEQAKPTAKTMAMVKQLLDYCALQEEAIMTFKASNMVLQVHSNAGYTNEKNHSAGQGGIFSYQTKTHPPQ